MKRLPQVQKRLFESDPPKPAALPRDLSDRAPATSIVRFSAQIAHDVNNPLAVVAANLEFLGELVAILRIDPNLGGPEGAREGLLSRLDEAEVCLRDAGEAVDRLRSVVTYVRQYVLPTGGPAVAPTGRDGVDGVDGPPGSSQTLTSRPPRLLVVDDDEIVARALQRTLRGFDVAVTLSAADALERVLAGQRFDAILCDVMMPGMTGYELHEAISNAVPEQAARMIFVTGGGTTRRAHEFLESVTNPVVDKPFDANHLRALIRQRMR
jgi:CheY-like chemotaxis protein